MLYFVPTPIGNLADVSHRILAVLEQCEVAICEDSRVTKSLINLLNTRYNLAINPVKFYSLHTHNEAEFFARITPEILNQKLCCYLTDAGMPCISDPGISLVKYAQENSIKYEVLSGANALLLAVAGSGLVQKEFSFLGFLPNRGNERKIAIQNALNSPSPVVIYESPERILSLVEAVAKIDGERKIFLIKEATKRFEAKFYGTANSVASKLNSANLNGEWCAVIAAKSGDGAKQKISYEDILSLQIAPKIKAKLLSKISGESVKKIYENLVK